MSDDPGIELGLTGRVRVTYVWGVRVRIRIRVRIRVRVGKS